MGPMLILHSMTGAMAHGEGGGGRRNRDMITLLKLPCCPFSNLKAFTFQTLLRNGWNQVEFQGIGLLEDAV